MFSGFLSWILRKPPALAFFVECRFRLLTRRLEHSNEFIMRTLVAGLGQWATKCFLAKTSNWGSHPFLRIWWDDQPPRSHQMCQDAKCVELVRYVHRSAPERCLLRSQICASNMAQETQGFHIAKIRCQVRREDLLKGQEEASTLLFFMGITWKHSVQHGHLLQLRSKLQKPMGSTCFNKLYPQTGQLHPLPFFVPRKPPKRFAWAVPRPSHPSVRWVRWRWGSQCHRWRGAWGRARHRARDSRDRWPRVSWLLRPGSGQSPWLMTLKPVRVSASGVDAWGTWFMKKKT